LIIIKYSYFNNFHAESAYYLVGAEIFFLFIVAFHQLLLRQVNLFQGYSDLHGEALSSILCPASSKPL
jgi:hypothetical protein